MDLASRLTWAQRAVERWSDFPVERHPRPLVLVGQRVFVERGFSSGEAKSAFLDGGWELKCEVPEAVRAELDSSASTPVPEPTGRPVPPFAISTATRSSTAFATDRGPRVLPAWRLEAAEVIGAIWVLAPDVDPPEWRPPPSGDPEPPNRPPHGHVSAELAADGVSITLHFTGGNPRFELFPRAEVVESAQAVALIPIKEDIGPPGWRTAEGYERVLTARLRAPLASRVLVDLYGHAAEVRQLAG